MSEQITFDRRKGFVALPVEIMDFDLTPGAFRTLAELCRMANPEGYCWPSLHQLSDRLGRSRAALSGYIKELRAAGLVATEEQRTANGYNYRLKYRVTFWQAWRSDLSRKASPENERSVHSAERLEESKNHIHKNHLKADEIDLLEKTLAQWTACFKGAPYPLANHRPKVDLIATTRALLHRDRPEETIPKAHTQKALSALWKDIGLAQDTEALAEQVEVVAHQHLSQPELLELLSGLRQNWPNHWRRQPSADQLRKLIRATGITSRAARMRVLYRHYKRWQLAEKTLQKTRGSCSVAA